MSESRNRDYQLTVEDANQIGAIHLFGFSDRKQMLKEYAKKNGKDALLNLFANFMGLTNALIENSREVMDIVLITEGNIHPHEAEKINLPSILGACQGVAIAMSDTPAMCGGCAFRIGTAANQSLITTQDAKDCTEDSKRFLCHEDVDEKCEPFRPRAGYAKQYRKNMIAADKELASHA